MNKAALIVMSLGIFAAFALVYAAEPATQPAGERVTTPSGLTIIKGDPSNGAQPGDHVWIHYTGHFSDGKVFDTSHKEANQPIDFVLGTGRVIKGWEEGIVGMNVGEKRELIIPPSLAYGEKGNRGVIPPNATLYFELQLMGVVRR